MANDHPERLSAREIRVDRIMTRPVVSIRPHATVDALVQTLLANGLSRLPVVDDDLRVVGIVTKTDVLEGEDESGPRDASLRVTDVMTGTPVTLHGDASVAEAARLMAQHHLHALPVVDADGRIQGLVSSLDVLAWLAGLK